MTMSTKNDNKVIEFIKIKILGFFAEKKFAS